MSFLAGAPPLWKNLRMIHGEGGCPVVSLGPLPLRSWKRGFCRPRGSSGQPPPLPQPGCPACPWPARGDVTPPPPLPSRSLPAGGGPSGGQARPREGGEGRPRALAARNGLAAAWLPAWGALALPAGAGPGALQEEAEFQEPGGGAGGGAYKNLRQGPRQLRKNDKPGRRAKQRRDLAPRLPPPPRSPRPVALSRFSRLPQPPPPPWAAAAPPARQAGSLRHGHPQQVPQRRDEPPAGHQPAPQDVQLQERVPAGGERRAQAAGERLLLERRHRRPGQPAAQRRAHRHLPHPGQLRPAPLLHPERQDRVRHQEPADPVRGGQVLPPERPPQQPARASLRLRPQAGPSLHAPPGAAARRGLTPQTCLLHLLRRREDPAGAEPPPLLQRVHSAALVPQDSQWAPELLREDDPAPSSHQRIPGPVRCTLLRGFLKGEHMMQAQKKRGTHEFKSRTG